MMKGQISIDYLAGALIFFGALVFLVSNVMTTLPAFSQAQEVDELTLSAWSISEVVMNDEGYWVNATHDGTDWHNHLGKLEVLGVEGEGGLSRKKVDALTGLNQTWIRSTLKTEKKVNVEFREVVDVDTHRTFQKGDSPDFVTEPTSSLYLNTVADEVHYGAREVSGEERYFLLTENPNIGWYNRLRVSDDWDFSDDTVRNLTETEYIPVDDATYIADAGNTEISDGNLLILWRDIGRTGDVPRDSVQDLVSVERYGVMDGNVVEVTFRIWE